MCVFCKQRFEVHHVDDEYHVFVVCPLGHHDRLALVDTVQLPSPIDHTNHPLTDRLTAILTCLASPTTPNHATALARLLTRTVALRALLNPIVREQHSLPDPGTLELKNAVTSFRLNDACMARNLPPIQELGALLLDLRKPQQWQTYLHPTLCQHAASQTLSEFF